MFILCLTLFSCAKFSNEVGNVDTLRIYDLEDGIPKELIGRYYSRFGVSIPKYYVVLDSLAIDLDGNQFKDTLVVFSPLILEDSRFGSLAQRPKRVLVEIMNVAGRSTIRNTYVNLISNAGGVLSKYNGMSLTNTGFEIRHQAGSRYSWEYIAEFSTAYPDSIYLVRLQKECSFDYATEQEEYVFGQKSVQEISIDDSLSANCNCDRIWKNIEKLKASN